MVGAPPSQIVNSAPAVALPPTNISDSGVAPRRKYTYADYMSLLQVAPLYATTADPVIADILAAHDIRNDAAYKENIEESQNKERMYGPFIQRGFEGDQRLYIAWTGPERGFGAFAEVGIPTGTPIGIYTGIVTNQSVGSRYSWHYNSDNEIKDEEGNPIGLSLDAWHNGNHLRFVNHDEQPNCVGSHELGRLKDRTKELMVSRIPKSCLHMLPITPIVLKERRNDPLQQPLARPLRNHTRHQTRRGTHRLLWIRILVRPTTRAQNGVHRERWGAATGGGAAVRVAG